MKNMKRRKFVDRTAHWVITFGGVAVIFVILILFLFIFLEVYPLLRGAEVSKENIYPLNDNAISIGVDEYQEVAYALYKNGTVEFISLLDGKTLKKYTITGLDNPVIAPRNHKNNLITLAAYSSSREDNKKNRKEHSEKALRRSVITSAFKDKDRITLGTNDGRVITLSITFFVSFENEKRIITPEISEKDPIQLDKKRRPLTHITSMEDERIKVIIATTADGKLILKALKETSLPSDEIEKHIQKDITHLIRQQDILLESNDAIIHLLPEQKKEDITSLALDRFMKNLYVGMSSGKIFLINIEDKENPVLQERIKVSDEAVTLLGFLLGDVSLVIGDSGGNVSIWMQVRNKTSSSGWSHNKIHILKSHNNPVVATASSLRDRSFITAASDGTIHLNHSTSERTLLNLDAVSFPTAITLSPRANGILAAGGGNLFQWNVSNPHPEITLKTLFGRVWYEGYEKPEFVWQSTGGTDEFEPKLSLIPLIFGTIKGTIYSLIIAVPIGIFGALYMSQFLHKSLKTIKPVIEIMAALPSVILGFLAGLLLAPLIERIFPAVVLIPFFMVLFIAIALVIWKNIPASIKGKYRYGIEALFLIPFIIGAVYLSFQLNTISESILFGGDFRHWLLTVLGLNYDQRNALIIGFAMGFAVIPLVFTISEDAMSNVPGHLTSASLALGATPWQTAIRVVLPTASPGIFSAVMIGFGRAVGETMIVLMATGNTPITDWNVFNGFRTLAANIAVETPEAPIGGTLYRVLFLTALLLFVMTFIVNTVAEVVRQAMRQKYRKL
jgi:phosphate transport system permease protein